MGVKIGENCSFLSFPDWGSEPYLISIGDNCRITAGVRFCTHDGGVHVLRRQWSEKYAPVPGADLFGKISIGNNVFIGIEAIILPGVTIGDNVIIGAGSVVSRDIPPCSVAAGIPARKIRSLEEYYLKNKDRLLETKGMDPKRKREILEKNIF